MASQFTYSARYDAALVFAARAHRDQLRKGSDIPYIVHPVHVSVILTRYGFGENLAIAGLLHDVVEDCGVAIEQIATEFGGEVAQLVEAVSEIKAANGVELPWEQRKAEKLARLRTDGPDVAALKAADAIHNARSIIADHGQLGAQIWDRFKRGADQTIEHYRSILEVVRAKLGDQPIALELAAAVEDLAAVERQETRDKRQETRDKR